ncbi:MAG: hypothetical protein HY907_21115 [Deltaproteobacteria bacterium]|nr:hypothetical protein [Deltaproteobacteria bacterium]
MHNASFRRMVVPGLVAALFGCSDGGGSTDVAADPGTEEDSGGEVAADADADVEPEADAEPEADVDGTDDADVETGAEVEAEADAGAEADVEAGTDTDADGGTRPPECVGEGGCTLYTDCCSCLALAAGEPPPPCGITECFVTTCSARGMDAADVTCAAGRCAAGYNCDDSTVVCLTPPPACPEGEVPSVSGSCWGACVPATECAYVKDCSRCDPDVQFCVQYVQRSGIFAHCVERLDECGAVPSCACGGASVCVAPFDSCGDDPAGPICSCPTCG